MRGFQMYLMFAAYFMSALVGRIRNAIVSEFLACNNVSVR